MQHTQASGRIHSRLKVLLPLATVFAAACGAASPPTDSPSPQARWATSAPVTSTPNFAILGGPAVTCTDSSVTGDIGAGFPGAPVTQTNCPVTGTVHAGDATAAQAYNDFLVAFLALGSTPCSTDPTHTLTGTLASVTLTPGVYCFDAAAALTGVLTLDAQGDAAATWTIKVGSGLTGGALTATNFTVVMADGGQPCNVSWWVADAATLTTSAFQGSIFAGAAITMTGPGSLAGRAMSKAAVTLTNMAPVGGCSTSGPGACQSSGDRVTGGGFITLPSTSKGTFGVSGGFKHGALRGHLEFLDHGTGGFKVHGTGVTQYLVVDAVTRHIEGTANVNGVAGFTYQVEVSDNGEPGRDDTFVIGLIGSDGASIYGASGKLDGGNIQLHEGDAGSCAEDRNDHGHKNRPGQDSEDDADFLVQ